MLRDMFCYINCNNSQFHKNKCMRVSPHGSLGLRRNNLVNHYPNLMKHGNVPSSAAGRLACSEGRAVRPWQPLASFEQVNQGHLQQRQEGRGQRLSGGHLSIVSGLQMECKTF